MTTVARTFPCPPDDVVAVLSDGWLYGLWVVGAARIRGVETDWPAQGTRLHHSSGPWPLHLDDHTTVVTSDLPRHLELTARAWPFGRARIHLTLTEVPGGTRVALAEEGVALVTVRRRWDSTAWPSASRGFFPFRKRIPALVRDLADPSDAVRLF